MDNHCLVIVVFLSSIYLLWTKVANAIKYSIVLKKDHHQHILWMLHMIYEHRLSTVYFSCVPVLLLEIIFSIVFIRVFTMSTYLWCNTSCYMGMVRQ